MADLEEMGFIASPHTSAGRVPTAKGYRFFVDSLMVTKPPDETEIQRLEGQLSANRPQQLVTTAAGLLSQLTQFAGVVMTPRRREATFRHLEFLRLAERRVLLILVTAEGDVQNRILHTDRSYSPSQLIEATNFFNQHFAGQTFATIRVRVSDELRALQGDIARLMTAAVDAGEGALAEGESLLVSGERNLLNSEDFASNMERLRRLFDLFDQKTSILHLLDLSQRAQGVQHLYRQRIGPRAARRMQRRDRAVRGQRQGGRHARRHRPHAHGVRARGSDRRPDREAPVQRHDAAAGRRIGACRSPCTRMRP